VRIAVSFLYWISIGPAVFFLLLDALVFPAKWAVHSMWAEQPPTGAWVALQVCALLAIIVAGWVVWFLWKHVRSVLLVDSDPCAKTWVDTLSPSLRIPVALCLVLTGAAILFLGVGGQLAPDNWRTNTILFGVLVQGAGLFGIVVGLNTSRSAAAQQGVEPDVE